jgi:hypothetical protein
MKPVVLVRGKTYSLKASQDVVEFEFVNEKTGQAMIHPLGEYDVAKWYGVNPDALQEYSSATVRAAKTDTTKPFGKMP